jgi:hypothetical protein
MTPAPFLPKVAPAPGTRMSSLRCRGWPDPGLAGCGLGDIRGYPPGSHAGIVVLRVPDQSAATVTKTISDLASLTDLASLAGSVAVLQRGLLRIRHP